MVDSPEKLRRICLRKFASLLKSDQSIWKKQLEGHIHRSYNEEKRQSGVLVNDQQKRKHQHDEDSSRQSMDSSPDQTLLPHQPLFIDYFLRGHCPLNSALSEHLVHYLVTHNQLNDFTLALFSPVVTNLRRLTINARHLSRLQCHILNQHPYLLELEIIFKNRTSDKKNEGFYQHVCPSPHSRFEEIYTVYSPFILHPTSPEPRRTSTSNPNSIQHRSSSSDEFSHHKLLNGLLTSLHPLTIDRLQRLSLSHYKFYTATHTTPTRKYSLADMSPSTKSSSNPLSISTPVSCVPTNLRLILKLTNVTSLNLGSTDIKDAALDIVLDCLTKIDTLDLSCCRSLKSFQCLLKLTSRLKWLNLYNCDFQSQRNPSIYFILYQLKHLEYLDISNDQTLNGPDNHSLIDSQSAINTFLSQDDCLPRLRHLDISGLTMISSECLHKFLLNHSELKFLGLFLTNEKYPPCLLDTTDQCYSTYRRYTYDLNHIPMAALTEDDLIFYEPYLLEALTRYHDRAVFVQKILYYIFFLTRSLQSKQNHLLIELILRAMSTHSNVQAIQMAATACIYNLTRTPSIHRIHVKYLTSIVQAMITVMETFTDQKQLQKNCLLTLCSDRLLHEPHFQFYLLATLVMNNLHNSSDLSIVQPGVAILSLLTTRLTIDECTQLGSVLNLKRILDVIEQQTDRLQTLHINQNHQVNNLETNQSQSSVKDVDVVLNSPQQLTSDDTLRFCLSLLWNLTDENAMVSDNFIQSMGLQLFHRLLHLFSSDTIVLTKIVGLLSNIAEVSHLKSSLYSHDLFSLMQTYMTDAIIDIAFSATGVLAHLICDQKDNEINLDLCELMRTTITTWQKPHTNMVTYRSFKPFLPLLHCARIPAVQLWALWAMHHVCSTDRNRYSRIIREEQIHELMQNLYDDHVVSGYRDNYLLHLIKSMVHLSKPCHSNRHQKACAVAS